MSGPDRNGEYFKKLYYLHQSYEAYQVNGLAQSHKLVEVVKTFLNLTDEMVANHKFLSLSRILLPNQTDIDQSLPRHITLNILWLHRFCLHYIAYELWQPPVDYPPQFFKLFSELFSEDVSITAIPNDYLCVTDVQLKELLASGSQLKHDVYESFYKSLFFSFLGLLAPEGKRKHVNQQADGMRQDSTPSETPDMQQIVERLLDSSMIDIDTQSEEVNDMNTNEAADTSQKDILSSNKTPDSIVLQIVQDDVITATLDAKIDRCLDGAACDLEDSLDGDLEIACSSPQSQESLPIIIDDSQAVCENEKPESQQCDEKDNEQLQSSPDDSLNVSDFAQSPLATTSPPPAKRARAQLAVSNERMVDASKVKAWMRAKHSPSDEIIEPPSGELWDCPDDDFLTSSPTTNRQHRKAWTGEEEELLVDAVKDIGYGKWAKILVSKKYEALHHRNNVQLKDKWRNLFRSFIAQLPPNSLRFTRCLN
eukprot:sb/3464270/